FSSISEDNKCWGIFEIQVDGKGFNTLTPTDQTDVDFFDSCYVPDGTLIAASTASKQGLPCMNGGAAMVNLYKVDPQTKNVRQITFEQDSDWHPTMMRNGRVMYMRWEYTDMMHYYSRILFHMNPDGTNQAELYGSGSLFPTTLKHAREVPGTNEIAVILSGHHGRGDTGRLAIIDPTVARKYPFRYKPTSKEWGPEGTQFDVHTEVLPAEKTGFIQEIPGFGQDVVGNVLDNQADGLKYNFIFPYPLSKNYFLVNCQIEGDNETYGLYLVDRFDNMTLIKKIEKQGLFYPIPLVKQEPPKTIPDRTDLENKEATVFITNIYDGQGTPNVPLGTLKKLRIFAYHFAYNNRGGHDAVGIRSGWDVKRILGEVPIEEDGSVFFTIPANTPISIQPLDEEGRAVQIMRSWFVGMPGENIACNGCHEPQLQVTPSKLTIASRHVPNEIEPFYGPVRSVTFETEVYYPVVKKYCMDCHDGSKTDRPDFSTAVMAYDNIHPFVRRPGPESDMEVLPSMEYHAGTSEICQMLEKNHYNVVLDKEAKERLYCWIDLNTPWRGSWDHPEISNRRMELEELYVGTVNNYEDDFQELLAKIRSTPVESVKDRPDYQKAADSPQVVEDAEKLRFAGIWPFSEEVAKEMQKKAAIGGAITKEIEMAPGVKITFARIPSGSFVMGSLEGYPDEAPRNVVEIEKPFWISTTEVTNAQYAIYDPIHDTRYIEEYGKDHIVPGHIANHPNQPVGRVSWDEVEGFTDWFSKKFGQKASLPTEAQWEWAARAGTDTKYPYGTFDIDFSKYANLSGAERLKQNSSFINGSTIHRRYDFPADGVFPLRDSRFSDKWFAVDYVAQYIPNAWGLYDSIGNNSEWTKSSYRPYPYNDIDG
ncbi:MAG: SUMF1/EgtB/PvdO family nonheme iron enzyme, partial [Thermoguttaceae bacterium]